MKSKLVLHCRNFESGLAVKTNHWYKRYSPHNRHDQDGGSTTLTFNLIVKLMPDHITCESKFTTEKAK